jgi:hypothetical protein
MNPLCEQAGCDNNTASKQAWKWENKHWHSHPSIAFTSWWCPSHFDETSGAHVGGHKNANRKWARKDVGQWLHKWYGVSCLDAWNSAPYIEEFDAWVTAGSPEKDEPFISVAVDYERQHQFWSGLKLVIDKIGKPMPKVSKGDIALEAVTARTMPDP